MKYFAPFLIIVLSIAVYSFVPKMYSNDSAVNLKKKRVFNSGEMIGRVPLVKQNQRKS